MYAYTTQVSFLTYTFKTHLILVVLNTIIIAVYCYLSAWAFVVCIGNGTVEILTVVIYSSLGLNSVNTQFYIWGLPTYIPCIHTVLILDVHNMAKISVVHGTSFTRLA